MIGISSCFIQPTIVMGFKKRNLRFLEGFILCSVAVSLAPPIIQRCSTTKQNYEFSFYSG
jgi:hypothetical protein